VAGYIYYAQTGETVRVIRDGDAPRTTPVYEARGDDALFVGAEGRVQWEVSPRPRPGCLTASYTRATRRGRRPAPLHPPLSGGPRLRYERGPWYLAGGEWSPQPRTGSPARSHRRRGGEPQEPTAGYGLLNMGAGWRHPVGGLTHSVSLEARNLTNRTWRDHLSRIKDIAPQPGRNLQLTYRVYF
jgi:iron complex outermembrane recepter protein